ncbi:MarR family transcriptional regulator [Oribacterium sp. C9]|uniref:MarR family winged helix-turn-helix transcriptional regulator n=1 Tax=Oribacterium sp. C9 TaxID=1943579 RepID=UPI00098FE8ED|nr:MarR family transcriptional regulator [Oribacterium sp. C9]OON86983.1 MarR family transcriptional regulator [Oribacterium sp. C9]
MERAELLSNIWEEQNNAYDYMYEYDSMTHYYGDVVLYQAEAYIVSSIGASPGITLTEIAEKLDKTTSACSQIVKKLVKKRLVEQVRNKNNKRVYNLRLTPAGEELYKNHKRVNDDCQMITFKKLDEFTDEELMISIKVQRALNEVYKEDVKRSKEQNGKSSL